MNGDSSKGDSNKGDNNKGNNMTSSKTSSKGNNKTSSKTSSKGDNKTSSNTSSKGDNNTSNNTSNKSSSKSKYINTILLHSNGMLYILSNTYKVLKTLYCDTFFLTDKGVYIIKDILNVLLLERGYIESNRDMCEDVKTHITNKDNTSNNTRINNKDNIVVTNTSTTNTPITNTYNTLYILRKYDKVFFINNKYICYNNNKITIIINNRIIKEITVKHHIYDILFIKGVSNINDSNIKGVSNIKGDSNIGVSNIGISNIDVSNINDSNIKGDINIKPCYLMVILTSKEIIYTDYNTLINNGIGNYNDRGVISATNPTNTNNTTNPTNTTNNDTTTNTTDTNNTNNTTNPTNNHTTTNPTNNDTTTSPTNPTNTNNNTINNNIGNYIFYINNMSIVNYDCNSVILKDNKYLYKYDINKRVLVKVLEIKDNKYIKKVLVYEDNVLFLYDSYLEDKGFRVYDVLDCYIGGCYLYVIKKNELSIYTMKYHRNDNEKGSNVSGEGVSGTSDTNTSFGKEVGDNTPLNKDMEDNTLLGNTKDKRPLNNDIQDNTPLNKDMEDNTLLGNTKDKRPLNKDMKDNTPLINNIEGNTPLNNTTEDNTPLNNTTEDNTPLNNINNTNTLLDNNLTNNTPNSLIYTLICSIEINILKTVCYNTIIYFITLNNTIKVDNSIYHMNVKCSDIYFYEYEGVIYVGIKNDCQFSFYSEEDINKCFKKGLGNEDIVDNNIEDHICDGKGDNNIEDHICDGKGDNYIDDHICDGIGDNNIDDKICDDIGDTVVIDEENKIDSFFSVNEMEFKERNEDLMDLCENVERLETTANRYGKEASDLKERMKKKFWFF
ncbi:hypothetical protein CWI39_1920p0010 [Hamiltosporidium magnivora]|uniref:Uncharacterized protein n=1 Tax=Hamiltosporidium magnivora TaxID=148818 RepID=A0A4Q9KYJ2_9MICR|nr:hypothetical protein CWI39_1920p0010 [Hamiltosporidium magnivora]